MLQATRLRAVKVPRRCSGTKARYVGTRRARQHAVPQCVVKGVCVGGGVWCVRGWNVCVWGVVVGCGGGRM